MKSETGVSDPPKVGRERLHPSRWNVVLDVQKALAIYRRLGFNCEPPVCPAFTLGGDGPDHRLSLANAHIPFERNFVEVVAPLSDNMPLSADTEIVHVRVTPEMMEQVKESAAKVVVRDRVNLFEGLHILMLGASDLDDRVKCLDAASVCHGPIKIAERRLITNSGPFTTRLRFLEIDCRGTPEGRLGYAENPPSEIAGAQAHLRHPNGAVQVDELFLCVPEQELEQYVNRYMRYVGMAKSTGPNRYSFELHFGSVTLLTTSSMITEFPGENPPALPAFVAFAVKVANLQQTKDWLECSGIPLQHTSLGAVYVPACETLGCAVLYRE